MHQVVTVSGVSFQSPTARAAIREIRPRRELDSPRVSRLSKSRSAVPVILVRGDKGIAQR